METPYPGEFFLLNFGCRKSTVLPEQSRNVEKRGVHHQTGVTYWAINSWSEDGDVVVTPNCLQGADIWFDPVIYNKIFMSNALAQAIMDIGMGDVFKLQKCRIVEVGQ